VQGYLAQETQLWISRLGFLFKRLLFKCCC